MTTPARARVHASHARKFLRDSETEFSKGDILQASDKLWGAAAHAVLALAASRGQHCGSHRAVKNVVIALNDRALTGAFGFAEKFHINFYHDAMEDFEIEADKPQVHWFVGEILGMVDAPAAG